MDIVIIPNTKVQDEKLMFEHIFYCENAPPSVVVSRDRKPQPMVVCFHDLAL